MLVEIGVRYNSFSCSSSGEFSITSFLAVVGVGATYS